MRHPLFTAFLLMSLAVAAQKKWTLQECISYSIRHNIALQQGAVSNDIAYNNAQQARASVLPSINAGAAHVYNVGKSIDRFTNTFANSTVLSQNFFISSNVTLWSGMSQHNSVRASHYNYLSGVEQLKQQENDLSLSVANAYIAVIFSEELLRISENQLKVTSEQLDRTAKMVKAGALAKSIEFDVKAQLASEEVNVTNAANNHDIALLSLRQLMNLDSAGSFDIVRPSIEVTESALLVSDVDQIYESGLKTQPGVKSADYAIISAEKNLAASRGRISPSLVFSASMGTGFSGLAQDITGVNITGFQASGITSRGDSVYTPRTELVTRKTPFADQFRNNVNKSIGFTLNVPIFNGLQTHTAVRNAKLSAFNAKLSRDLVKQNLYKDVAQAVANARAALNNYNSNLLNVEAAAAAFKYAQEKFNAGVISPFDFSNSKNRLFAAESNLLQAKYDYIFKLKVLNYYQGKPLQL